MSPEEEQAPLTQRLQGDGPQPQPARRQARLVALVLAGLGAVCLVLGGLHLRLHSPSASAENLRGAVGLSTYAGLPEQQWAPSYDQVRPPRGMPYGATGCGPGAPVIMPATTPCPEIVPAPPKEDLSLTVGHMEDKQSWELTWAQDGDDVEVRWISSPLLKERLGGTAAFFGLFHVGLAFHNSRTGLDTVVQFRAKKFGLNLLVGEVDRAANKITWDTAAEIVTQEGQVDTGYWVKQSRVATIKGTHYNELLKWVPSVAGQYTNYFLFNLAPLGQQLQQPHLPGQESSDGWPAGAVTCADVAQAVLDQLRQIAGEGVFNGDCSDVMRTDAYLWAKPGATPRKLDMTPGAEDFEQVMAFYEVLKAALADRANGESYPVKQFRQDAMLALQSEALPVGIYMDAHWDYWTYDLAERYAGARRSEARHYPGAPL